MSHSKPHLLVVGSSNTDMKGSFFMAQLCARQMVAQKPRGGSIIQIASVHWQGATR